jgi:hypothetical protein
MSAGNMSGVQEMRLAVALTDCAIARASMVLPVPGTSSKRMWPSQMIATIESRQTSVLPFITFSMLSMMASK